MLFWYFYAEIIKFGQLLIHLLLFRGQMEQENIFLGKYPLPPVLPPLLISQYCNVFLYKEKQNLSKR